MMKKFSAVSGTDHLRYVLVSKKRNEEWKKRTSKSYRERRVQNANQIGARQQGKKFLVRKLTPEMTSEII
jgi:hypothetical protein